LVDKKEYRQKDILNFDEETGTVEAVFSVFNEIDSDNDVVLPKSIRSGYGDKGVAMVWGHDWKNIIGKGKIIQDDNKAVFKGSFNMNTNAGKKLMKLLKLWAIYNNGLLVLKFLIAKLVCFLKTVARKKKFAT